jgi:uncharacterized membrane protein
MSFGCKVIGMDSFTRFNLYEGTFWIFLGIVSFMLKKKLPKKYSSITLVATWVFILFGISDYVEVQMGGFLYPTIYWLLAWKVACVVGMVFVVGWYFKLRLQKS